MNRNWPKAIKLGINLSAIVMVAMTVLWRDYIPSPPLITVHDYAILIGFFGLSFGLGACRTLWTLKRSPSRPPTAPTPAEEDRQLIMWASCGAVLGLCCIITTGNTAAWIAGAFGIICAAVALCLSKAKQTGGRLFIGLSVVVLTLNAAGLLMPVFRYTEVDDWRSRHTVLNISALLAACEKYESISPNNISPVSMNDLLRALPLDVEYASVSRYTGQRDFVLIPYPKNAPGEQIIITEKPGIHDGLMVGYRNGQVVTLTVDRSQQTRFVEELTNGKREDLLKWRDALTKTEPAFTFYISGD